jgi:hypothetical protein
VSDLPSEKGQIYYSNDSLCPGYRGASSLSIRMTESLLSLKSTSPMAMMKERETNRSICLEIKQLKTEYFSEKDLFDQICQQRKFNEEKAILLQATMDEINNRSYVFTQFISSESSWESLQHEQILETLNKELEARQSLVQEIEQIKNDITQIESKISERKHALKKMHETISKMKDTIK